MFQAPLRFLILTLLLTLLTVLAGCAPGTFPNVQSVPPPQIDADAWARLTYAMSDDLASSSLRRGVMSLHPVRLTDEGDYRLRVDYWGDDWLLIPPGPSLRLTIDGRPVVLSSLGSSGGRGVRTISAYARRFERAEYPVSLDLLRQLSQANVVRVTLTGSRDLERILDRRDLERFVVFYTQVTATGQQ